MEKGKGDKTPNWRVEHFHRPSATAMKPKRPTMLDRLKGGLMSVARPSTKPESVIGLPYNFQHSTHVQPDPNHPLGFSGLPPAWASCLETSGITREEALEHPDAVLHALETAMNGPPSKPPARKDVQTQQEKFKALLMEDPKTIYYDFKKLGSGASGMVYKVKHKQTGKVMALKYCSLEADTMSQLLDEIIFQRSCNHKNIVTMHDCYQVKNQVAMAMELMDGGMLTNYCSTKAPMPEPCIAYVAKHSLMGLCAIHRFFRVHRDIKSDNILVDSSGNVKLADFGFGAFLVRFVRACSSEHGACGSHLDI